MHRRQVLRSSVMIALVTMLVMLMMGGAVQAAQSASPAALTVTTAADSGPGSLRAVIASAAPGDTISFGSFASVGGVGAAGPIVLTSGEIAIDKSMSISGPGAGDLTISGNKTSRVFTILAGAVVTITGLTIADGHPGNASIGIGGGILNFGTLTLAHSVVTNNQSGDADPGGGIYNQGTLAVTQSVISGNWSPGSAGGGIENWIGAVATIDRSAITGNRAALPAGGNGIDNEGTMIITSSSIANNSGGHGGGINNRAGTLTITASTITGNTAVDGAGGIDNGASLTITDSTIAGNVVTHHGTGGIDNHGTMSITNCTVAYRTEHNISHDTGQAAIRAGLAASYMGLPRITSVPVND